MITRFTIRNFKRLHDVTLELGRAAVFIGPNNSGKTTALQALALWDIGWRRWAEKRDTSKAKDRTGVTINRRDLFAIPVPSAKLLWANLHTHENTRLDGQPKTRNVYITLSAEGDEGGIPWVCSLDFYYANEESFYCRLREGATDAKVPDGARRHSVVYLPPMSGLAEREYRKEQGEISVLIGEGQTAQVLRNLCWQLHTGSNSAAWGQLCAHIARLFDIRLNAPLYIKERSELSLTYTERESRVELDLSSAGRGCQQVLLLLSFLLANPGALLLLDEPDAHLEILRQRDVYNLLTDVAAANGSQIVAASHSEVVLQEAAERDVVMAFVGRPHRIDTRKGTSQVRKALESIRMSDYYLAEQKGWMLYLEGSTDLAILRRLAIRLDHPARALLTESVPVVYLGSNKPQDARDHFYGLREAKSDLVGFALFDRLDRELHTGAALTERMWSRREIENYLVTPQSLSAFVVADLMPDDLISALDRESRLDALQACVDELVAALSVTGNDDPWGPHIKVTDDFLDPLFRNYFRRLGTPQRIYKNDYHGLADVISLDLLDPEITVHLDALVEAVSKSTPAVA